MNRQTAQKYKQEFAKLALMLLLGVVIFLVVPMACRESGLPGWARYFKLASATFIVLIPFGFVREGVHAYRDVFGVQSKASKQAFSLWGIR